jgi:monofunctional biosynthetic peptidoglycan transglycosylase
MAKPRKAAPGFRWGRALRNLFLGASVALLVVPIVAVIAYRFMPPPITILMIERMMEGKGLDRRWRPLSEMSPALPRALVSRRSGIR